MRQSGELQKEHEELLLRLNNSGYKALEAELADLTRLWNIWEKQGESHKDSTETCSMERTGDYVQPDNLGY